MLPHGFKSRAERQAADIRKELGLNPRSPLPARNLCGAWDIDIISPGEIPGMPMDLLSDLTVVGQDAWSAVTIPAGSSHIIIVNSEHSKARQESNLMHELAHLTLDHTSSQFLGRSIVSLPIRQYDKQQEEEASWLGGTIQLPRPALLWSIESGMSNEDITAYYGASLSMVGYRRRVTGVDRQMQKA